MAFSTRQKHHTEHDASPNNDKKEDISIFVVNCINIRIMQKQTAALSLVVDKGLTTRVTLFLNVIAKYISAPLITRRTTHAKLM